MTDSALLRKLQDEQYLYRLASTYAWDEAIEFCDRSILGIEQAYDDDSNTTMNGSCFEAEEYFDEYLNNHYVNLKKEPWLVARPDMCQTRTKKLSVHEWIRYLNVQISFADQWGNTPLHSASFCKPPDDMIVALFRLARSIRRFASLLLVDDNGLSDCDRMNSSCDFGDYGNGDGKNVENAANLIIWAATCKDGSTPLLVASSTGASTDVLHCYLDEIEYYIDNNWLNEKQSEEWARKTVVRPDFSGVTPLMGWMAYHEVWIKRQLNPSSRNVRDLPKLSDHWEMTKRMLQFATKTDFMDDSNQHQTMYTLIQQCASITLYCPISLLEWVVSPHRQGIANTTSSSSQAWSPPDICASTPDRTTGKLLFHVAMEARPFAFDSRLKPSNPPRFRARLEKNRIQMIKKLLTWYPDAANVSFQLVKFPSDTTHVEPLSAAHGSIEVRSRSPFIQAISSGMTWWHTLNTATSKEDGDDYMGLVQLLWRLNPGEIASERDEVSGLYPFMLAATTLKPDATRSEERLVVDTTFNLLKKNPELVSGALMTSGTED